MTRPASYFARLRGKPKLVRAKTRGPQSRVLLRIPGEAAEFGDVVPPTPATRVAPVAEF